MRSTWLIVAVVSLFTAVFPLLAGESEHWDGNYLQLLDEPREKQPANLQALAGAAVPSASAAKEIAWQVWEEGHHIRAYQGWHVVRLFPSLTRLSSAGIGGMGSTAHWIWEVHFGPPPAVEGIVLVDAETKEAKVVFPSSVK